MISPELGTTALGCGHARSIHILQHHTPTSLQDACKCVWVSFLGNVILELLYWRPQEACARPSGELHLLCPAPILFFRLVSEPTCGCRAAAEAWEAAFVELARTQLSAMAANAGLRLSFSSERSVADELARESYADVSTVRTCLLGA